MIVLLGLALTALAAGPASSQAPARGHGAEARDMELVGHDDLQGPTRSCKVAIRLTGDAARIVGP